MKKIRSSVLWGISVLAASSAFAADLVVDSDKSASGTYGSILFTTNGVTLTASSHITAADIAVSDGVSATASTANTYTAYYLGGGGEGVVSGAGSSASSLLFNGYILGSTFVEVEPDKWAAVGNLSISDLSLSLQRNVSFNNNLLRGESIALTNANLNILASGGASNISTYAAAGVADFTLSSSTVNVADGATLSMSVGSGYQSYKKLSDSSINVDGTLIGLTNVQFTSGANTISGSGSVSMSFVPHTTTLTTKGMWASSGLSAYITASTISCSSSLEDESRASTLYIGQDSFGAENAVNFSSSFVQFNSSKLIVAGASTLTINGNFNLASTGRQSSFGTGSTITVSSGTSRINNAYIDGAINVSGGAQVANGWNYCLAFGTYSTTGANQIGNVILGSNAEINVVSSKAEGTYFGVYGTLTSNAGVGKITSNNLAPLMLYTGTTLTLNSSDAFAVGGAATQAASTFNLYTDAVVGMVVNADNNIGAISFGNADAKLALDIAAGKILTVGQFSNAAADGLMEIALGDDIVLGEFKITDMDAVLSDYDAQTTLSFTDGTSARTLGDNLFISETSLGSGEYWVYTAVPEPAEWAALFGVLVLGFVICRKRRK